MWIISPKGFLQVGGGVLVLIAILGYFGIIGPTPAGSLFGGAWYFDNAENVAHLVLGVVALAASMWLSGDLQKKLVILVGALAVLVGLYSLIGSSMLIGANLENPADSILHLAIGAWALWAAFRKESMGGMM